MIDPAASAAARLAALRQDFDQGFAAPDAAPALEQENLIAIRIEGDRYGLSVREIRGVAVAGKLVALPSRSPGLLGLTGIRGAIIPVYSLAALLGYAQAGGAARWLALCGANEPVALVLGDFEGYVRVPTSALLPPDRERRAHVHRFVQAGDIVRAIVSVASVLSSIQKSSGPKEPFVEGGIA